MRGYVSIDIETTGISDNCHVLQISAVYDDLTSPISQLNTIDLPIKWDVMTHCEPYAMGMNAELLKKMMDKEFVTYTPQQASDHLIHFLHEVCNASKQKNVIFAGKNVASFDIPKLNMFMSKFQYKLKEFKALTHYKTLDVGSLYYDVFKDNVSLTKINELTNRPAVSHNALEDAFDVVHAVRHKLGVSRE
jgi:hypothetical protein